MRKNWSGVRQVFQAGDLGRQDDRCVLGPGHDPVLEAELGQPPQDAQHQPAQLTNSFSLRRFFVNKIFDFKWIGHISRDRLVLHSAWTEMTKGCYFK